METIIYYIVSYTSKRSIVNMAHILPVNHTMNIVPAHGIQGMHHSMDTSTAISHKMGMPNPFSKGYDPSIVAKIHSKGLIGSSHVQMISNDVCGPVRSGIHGGGSLHIGSGGYSIGGHGSIGTGHISISGGVTHTGGPFGGHTTEGGHIYVCPDGPSGPVISGGFTHGPFGNAGSIGIGVPFP